MTDAALPLSERHASPLIGPLADAPGEMRGCWPAAGRAEDCVSVLAGLRAALPTLRDPLCARASTSKATTKAASPQAAALCDGADAIILCLGEAANMSGEAASRAHPGLPGQQDALGAKR